MQINPNTKVRALDAAHSVAIIAVGTAAALAVMYLTPVAKGQWTLPSVGVLAGALAVGYVVAFLADNAVARAVRLTRGRWLDQAAAAQRTFTVPADQA